MLATSAVANGLFDGDPFAVGISGGFASPTAQRLLAEADVVVAFGAALNMWTTRHGGLIAPATTVIQVDRDEEAIGAHRPVDLGRRRRRARDRRGARRRARPALARRHGAARRSVALAAEIAARALARRAVRGARATGSTRATLSIALDDLLPAERTVVVDSGAFMGYPSMYLRVPDAQGFVFPQAFQCVGLGARQRDRRRARAARPADGRARSATAGC